MNETRWSLACIDCNRPIGSDGRPVVALCSRCREVRQAEKDEQRARRAATAAWRAGRSLEILHTQ